MLHNPYMTLRLLTRRSDYQDVLRERVAKDLAFMRCRVLAVSANADFLEMTSDEIDEKLGLLAPANTKSSWKLLNRWHVFLYVVTRASASAIVIETGVLYGQSSASILAGLEDNHRGRLISVDLPAQEHRSIVIGRKHIQVGLDSEDLSVGCAVPFALRSRWSLRFGNSLELLPKILEETGPVSIFIHDSLHTYDHMMAEFRLGYDALEPGGMLISDDIDYNSAWSDFCLSKRESWKALSKGSGTSERFGFLIKSNEAGSS